MDRLTGLLHYWVMRWGDYSNWLRVRASQDSNVHMDTIKPRGLCEAWLEKLSGVRVQLPPRLWAEEVPRINPASVKAAEHYVYFFYYHCVLKKLSSPSQMLCLQIEELRPQKETGGSVHLLELPPEPPHWRAAETALLPHLCTQWNDGDGTAGLRPWPHLCYNVLGDPCRFTTLWTRLKPVGMASAKSTVQPLWICLFYYGLNEVFYFENPPDSCAHWTRGWIDQMNE